jgi:hypothetical protein
MLSRRQRWGEFWPNKFSSKTHRLMDYRVENVEYKPYGTQWVSPKSVIDEFAR